MTVHPLLSTDYLLPTPPIEQFVATIKDWVSATVPGGVVCGKSRVGKTAAIDYVVAEAQTIFGAAIPVVKMTWEENAAKSETQFLRRVLISLDSNLLLQGNAEELEGRVVQSLVAKASNALSHRVILFLDEAHLLNNRDYGWLSHLYNRLRHRKVYLTTFLVGEYKLLDSIQLFRDEGRTQFIGRFMNLSFEFPALTSSENLAAVLRVYDDETEYPEGSRCSYVQHFLPKAVAQGWRLDKQSELIWITYGEERRALPIAAPQAMPMQHCTVLVTALLQFFSKKDSPRLELQADDLKRLVQAFISPHF